MRNPLAKKTVFTKITFLFSIFLLFVFILVTTGFTVFKLIETDGNAINISGSERMRTMLLGFTTNRYYQVTEETPNPREAARLKKVITFSYGTSGWRRVFKFAGDIRQGASRSFRTGEQALGALQESHKRYY